MKFNNLIKISNKELVNEIDKIEISLANLMLKKSTRQTFKSNELDALKQKLAKIKQIFANRLFFMKKIELLLNQYNIELLNLKK
jgi:ribosomal protein L29